MFKSTKEYKKAVKLILDTILEGKTSPSDLSSLDIEPENYLDAWQFIAGNGLVTGIAFTALNTSVNTFLGARQDETCPNGWSPRLTYNGLAFFEKELAPLEKLQSS